MSQSTQKQPVAPTPHNIKLAWCKANNKKIANLKQDDYNKIITYAVEIGAMIGVQETHKVYQKAASKSLSEKTPIENETPDGAEG
jgi:hypothetical protein